MSATQGNQGPTVVVPQQLLQILRAQGIKGPEDGLRLSQDQMAALLEGKSPENRLEIKFLSMASGIYPRKV